MYSIDALCPTGGMGGHGFLIHLSPEFKEAVLISEIDQAGADRVIKTFGPEWLVKCGFNHYFDIENCGWERQEYKIPSDNTKLSEYIRLGWGEWGPEHIIVPGNACGLDLDRTPGCVFHGGKMLVPHNVDSWNQKMLLLLVFTWFSHTIALNRTVKEKR